MDLGITYCLIDENVYFHCLVNTALSKGEKHSTFFKSHILSTKKKKIDRMKIVLMFLFSIHLLMHGAFCILRNCTQEIDGNKVCRNGMSQNHPIELNTTVYLREIVKINEEENSITM